jgi:hypothetical protein
MKVRPHHTKPGRHAAQQPRFAAALWSLLYRLHAHLPLRLRVPASQGAPPCKVIAVINDLQNVIRGGVFSRIIDRGQQEIVAQQPQPISLASHISFQIAVS